MASAVFMACWLYGFIDWQIAVRAGGSTALGKVENGRYFLGSHGVYTEVSNDEWHERKARERIDTISWLIGIGCFTTIVLATPLFRRVNL